MKVLIIRTFPDQLNIGSYNVQEIGLAGALRRKGVLCDIVLFEKDAQSHEEVLADGTKIYWRRGINFVKNGFFPGLRGIAERYDVLQVHEYDQLQSWVIYSFWRKKPVVLYHGPYYDRFNKGYNLKCAVFDHLLLPWSGWAKRNVRVLTKSPLAADFMRSKGFTNVKAVGVGLNPEALKAVGVGHNLVTLRMADVGFNPDVPEAENYVFYTEKTVSDTAEYPKKFGGKENKSVEKSLQNSDGFISSISKKNPVGSGDSGKRTVELLYVGKLEPRRNTPFLLDLMEELSADPELEGRIHFTIIGTGEKEYVRRLQPRMDALAKRGLLAYREKASQQELGGIYRRSDLFLFPTNYDIFGMVLLECMYYGCVPVSSVNGGSSMLIRDGVNGRCIGAGKEESWFCAVKELILDPGLRQRMAEAAAETIRKQFTWDAVADEFVEAYREAVKH